MKSNNIKGGENSECERHSGFCMPLTVEVSLEIVVSRPYAKHTKRTNFT